MNNIIIVGTTFSNNGYGVPTMSSEFYRNISNFINVDKLEILKDKSNKLPYMNQIITRNLNLLAIKKKIIGRNIHVMHTIDLCLTIPLMNLSKYAEKKIITVHDFYPFYSKPNRTFISILDDIRKRRCYQYLDTYDHIFATTEEISNKLMNNYKIDPEKISVQGPIIGYEYLPMNIEKRREKIIIGYINNFTWNKTAMLKYFIKIFKSIESRE